MTIGTTFVYEVENTENFFAKHEKPDEILIKWMKINEDDESPEKSLYLKHIVLLV